MPKTVPPFARFQAPLFPLRGLWNAKPPEGDCFCRAEIDWTTTTEGLTAVQFSLSGNTPIALSRIVALSVDNSDSGADVDFLFPGSGFLLTVAAHTQGLYPVFSNALMFYASAPTCVAGDTTTIQILNSVPPPAQVPPTGCQLAPASPAYAANPRDDADCAGWPERHARFSEHHCRPHERERQRQHLDSGRDRKGLAKANETGSCENVKKFSHRLEPTFLIRPDTEGIRPEAVVSTWSKTYNRFTEILCAGVSGPRVRPLLVVPNAAATAGFCLHCRHECRNLSPHRELGFVGSLRDKQTAPIVKSGCRSVRTCKVSKKKGWRGVLTNNVANNGPVPNNAKKPLAGRRILLAEDEGIIALELERMLVDLGCDVIGPVASIEGVLENAERGGFDGAVLDINLRGRQISEIMPKLQKLGLRLIITSGYDMTLFPPPFRALPRIPKPFDEREVRRVCERVFANPATL
jgi:hypothetical protein